MEGDFQEGKPGYYEVKNFEEIDGFDPDQFGNIWYNVIFQGNAETFMWLKKDPPVEGQKYYGHLEKTRSGKRLRFKTDKAPEQAHTHNTAPKSMTDYEPGTNARWAIGLAYRAHLQVTGTPDDAQGEFPFDAVKQHASALVSMYDEIKGGGSAVETRSSGYDKFKQTKQSTFNDGSPLPEYSDPFPN